MTETRVYAEKSENPWHVCVYVNGRRIAELPIAVVHIMRIRNALQQPSMPLKSQYSTLRKYTRNNTYIILCVIHCIVLTCGYLFYTIIRILLYRKLMFLIFSSLIAPVQPIGLNVSTYEFNFT